MFKTKIIISSAITLFFASCISVKEIGRLNVVSTRNILPGEQHYEKIATYAGELENELKKSKFKTIDEAVNNTVKNYPGGEFLTNVKLFKIKNKDKIYYAVSGDVYGVKNKDGKLERSYRGFAVGDTIVYSKIAGIYSKGIFEEHIDNETCLIKKINKNGKIGRPRKMKYQKLYLNKK